MAFKLIHYAKGFAYNKLPDFYFSRKYRALKEYEGNCDQEELHKRLDYYCKIEQRFKIPEESISNEDFKLSSGTNYYLDLKAFLHFFTGDARFAYKFGDDTDVYPFPCLIKARPIDGDNSNSVLFKLNKWRHFRWVKDSLSFSEKENILVWRGGAYGELRRRFVEQFWDHELCDVGQTNKPKEDSPWQKDPLSISAQLKYKFILSLEGNDVATNLKWAMSSNSLCIMPRPKFETWFMEGSLKPGIHYVEVKSDFSDLEDKILYYTEHTDEAEEIIGHANRYVQGFQNPMLEDLLCLKVLERYMELSGQSKAFKFTGK
jgi:hypothetical protein